MTKINELKFKFISLEPYSPDLAFIIIFIFQTSKIGLVVKKLSTMNKWNLQESGYSEKYRNIALTVNRISKVLNIFEKDVPS